MMEYGYLMNTSRTVKVSEDTAALLVELVTAKLRRLVGSQLTTTGATSLTTQQSADLLTQAVSEVVDTVSAATKTDRAQLVGLVLDGLRG